MARLAKFLSAALVLGVALFFWVGANLERLLDRVEPVALPEVSDAARSLHDQGLVIDLHADSLLFGRDLLERSDVGHLDLPRLRDGGVGLQVFSTVTKVPSTLDIHHTDADGVDLLSVAAFAQRSPFADLGLKDRALLQAERLARLVERSGGLLVPVRSRAELKSLIERRANDPRIIGAILGIEGAHALEGDLSNLEVFYAAGVRTIGLTHFFDNEFAGSAHGVEKGGLTRLGRKLVARMEELGILVDLAHVSPAAIDDVLAMATRPVIFSHGGVRATCDNPRNLSDEHVRAIAAGAGVIGIGYWELAVCGTDPRDVVAAIRHVVDLVGDDYVALGSDFDGATTVGFDASQLRALTQALLDDGLSDDSVRKVLGGNALRVLRQTLPPR